MAVTIVGSLSVATAGRAEIRTVLAAALGCNLAWGLVDAVMYLLRTVTDRTRNRILAKRIAGAEATSAQQLIAQALPAHVIAITGPDELEGMRRRLVSSTLPGGIKLGSADYLAAFGIFLLVVLATFPVVVPFIVVDDAARAMNLSRVVTVVMLFIAGVSLGRHAGYVRPWVSGVLMALLGVAIIAAVKALGG
jgi:VIT1/CCC1 family predicted Fe2+/Mn2+ transporter